MSVILMVLGIWFASSVLFGLLAGRFFQTECNLRYRRARRYPVAHKVWHIKPEAG